MGYQNVPGEKYFQKWNNGKLEFWQKNARNKIQAFFSL